MSTENENKQNEKGCGCGSLIGIILIIIVFLYSCDSVLKEMNKSPLQRELESVQNEALRLGGISQKDLEERNKKHQEELRLKEQKRYDIIPAIPSFKSKAEELYQEYSEKKTKMDKRAELGVNVENERKEVELLLFKINEIMRILYGRAYRENDILYNSSYNHFFKNVVDGGGLYTCCGLSGSVNSETISSLYLITDKIIDLQNGLNQGTISKDEFDKLFSKLKEEALFLKKIYDDVINLTEIPEFLPYTGDGRGGNPFLNTCCKNNKTENKKVGRILG